MNENDLSMITVTEARRKNVGTLIKLGKIPHPGRKVQEEVLGKEIGERLTYGTAIVVVLCTAVMVETMRAIPTKNLNQESIDEIKTAEDDMALMMKEIDVDIEKIKKEDPKAAEKMEQFRMGLLAPAKASMLN